MMIIVCMLAQIYWFYSYRLAWLVDDHLMKSSSFNTPLLAWWNKPINNWCIKKSEVSFFTCLEFWVKSATRIYDSLSTIVASEFGLQSMLINHLISNIFVISKATCLEWVFVMSFLYVQVAEKFLLLLNLITEKVFAFFLVVQLSH
jgi:hypothetical protein